VFDYSAFKNNVAATSTPAQGAFSPYGLNWSVYFTPSTDYITSPASASNQLTSDFTIEFWSYQTTSGAQRGLIGINATVSSGAAGFSLYVTTDAKLTFFITGNGTVYTTANSVIIINTWQHIAFVRSGSTNTIYVNGVSVFTNSTSATWPATPVITIGRIFADNTAGAGAGYISNLRVIKGTALYTVGFTVPILPLNIPTNTVLLTCASNRFIDITGVTVSNTSTFTITGTPSVSRFTPYTNQGYNKGVIGGSTYFNGTTDYLSVSTANTSTNIDLSTNTPNWTIETWFYTTSLGVQQTILQKDGVSGTRQSQYAIYLQSSNLITLTLSPAVSSTGNQNFVGPAVTSNTWYHVAAVRSGSNITLFLNGVIVAGPTALSITMGNNTGALTIGTTSPGASNFAGYISDLRIVNGTALYSSNFNTALPPAPIRPVTNTVLLLNMTDAAVTDASMQTNVSTVGDARSLTTTIKKYNSSLMYFDGTGDYLSVLANAAYNFGTGDFTIEFWAYTTSTARQIIIGNYLSAGLYGWAVQINVNATGDLFFGWGNTTVSNPTSVWSANQWNHVAVARSGTIIKLFVNGVQASSVTDATNYNNGTNLVIGRNADLTQTAFSFIGYIDDLRVTKGVARYVTAFTPPGGPPRLR
jgi:hypothetical protein